MRQQWRGMVYEVHEVNKGMEGGVEVLGMEIMVENDNKE
jgi:hypothetical protein